ncbi:TonB-dependent receptor [Archangium lansingense]|uniref:TonB-dependent receptor n=1 Tax=Archangium lansingense TaxID=2995310 RepID=A0ABT4A9Z3_9BACT|nr:TonB-dependent receptor [Archangium lansinium]MCY1078466.1 TonB-dependent receptor [Archangium lansinium]
MTITFMIVPGQAAWAQEQGGTTQAQTQEQGGTVQGQVTAAYGDPLWGVSVAAKGTKRSVQTDMKGNYTLTGLPPGEVTLDVRGEGFMSQSRKVTVSADAPAQANFALELDLLAVEEIVVTAQTPDRKVRSSTAISTLNEEEIKARMPRSTADLMRVVPGFYVESSGGEVGGNLFVRGLPADGSYRYVALMEDGMPVFDSTELFFVNNDIFVRVDETLERVEAVRGGTSALYGSNAPGGVVNFISKTGGDKLAGTIKASTATAGLYRFDANLNGPIGDDWRFSVGGFYRFDNGVRYPGFPASTGGQFKGSLLRNFNTDKVNGHVRATFKYLNDRNTFYLPLPLRGRFGGDGRLTGYDFVEGFPIDGTLTSPEGVNSQVPLPRGAGLLDLPLGNGQQQIGGSATAELRLYFPEGRWEVQDNLRVMQMNHSWNAMLPFELRDADAWARSVVGEGTPYRLTCVNAPGSPAFGSGECSTPNNLVNLGGQWLVNKPMSNVSNQLRFTKYGSLGATEHTLSGGLYLGYYTVGNSWYFNDIVTDVRSRPRFLELQVLDGSGNVVRNVTQNGFRRYLSNYTNGTGNATIAAAFLGDEVKIGEKFRIDLAGRVERNAYQQNVERTAAFDLGDPTTTADDNALFGTGKFQRVNVSLTDWALSGGVNYALSDTASVYARSSRGYKMPLLDQYLTATDPSDPAFPQTPEMLWQNEAGIKLGASWYALAAVAYWLQIENFPSQDARVDPVTGDTSFVTVYAGKARTLGLELEAAVQPIKWFRAQGMLTVQDPRYTEFNEGANDFSGNRIRRIPQVIGDVTGTFMYGNATLGINWNYVGHRFSNNANTVDLPGYSQFNVRAGYTYENFTLDLQLFNALNSIGLTEGNPRVDESIGAVPDIFLARPVLPRRLMLSLTARL